MIRFLAEDARYKVYSLAETVYLKRKAYSRHQGEYERQDVAIAWHYGDPSGALILGDYVIVTGCGLTIYAIATREETHLFAEPTAIRWTDGLHLSFRDDPLDFRYVHYDDDDRPRIYKMNASSKVEVQVV